MVNETSGISYRLTRLETQLEERYKVYHEMFEQFGDRLTRIETLLQQMPSSNGRDHIIHIGAASLGGGSVVAAIIELVKALSG